MQQNLLGEAPGV